MSKVSENQLNNIGVDFDGVIHTFDKGWYDGICYGKPIDGSLDVIKKLSENGTLLFIMSSWRQTIS